MCFVSRGPCATQKPPGERRCLSREGTHKSAVHFFSPSFIFQRGVLLFCSGFSPTDFFKDKIRGSNPPRVFPRTPGWAAGPQAAPPPISLHLFLQEPSCVSAHVCPPSPTQASIRMHAYMTPQRPPAAGRHSVGAPRQTPPPLCLHMDGS